MSYGGGAALQAAVYARLAGDAALEALVGGAVHDAVPPGTSPGTSVVIGEEVVRNRADGSGSLAEHRFTVSVISGAAGFALAKEAAAAVTAALTGAPLVLEEGRLVGLWFQRAQARRVERGALRRIDLTYRALVED